VKTLTLTIKGGVDKDGYPDAMNEIEISRGEIIGNSRAHGLRQEHLIGDIGGLDSNRGGLHFMTWHLLGNDAANVLFVAWDVCAQDRYYISV
jgi:hypothetical protein